MASQIFLRKVLPQEMTWNDVVKLFGDKGAVDHLNKILLKSHELDNWIIMSLN